MELKKRRHNKQTRLRDRSEMGLITQMHTDSSCIADKAVAECRVSIGGKFEMTKEAETSTSKISETYTKES